MPLSTVRVTFEGMLLLFVKDNTAHCDVGFLRDIPHHYSEVQITRIPRGGAPEIIEHLHGARLKDKLWLDTNKLNQRVYLHMPEAEFRRDQSDPNSGDFRWAVNLEGDEVYNRSLRAGIAFGRLNPMLRIADGKFSSQTPLSTNKLTRKRITESNFVTLGNVATQLKAEIQLDAGQEATFFNGPATEDRIQLLARQGVDYGVYVCNKREHGNEDGSVDADNYHSVVANDIAPGRYIRFGRYPDDKATPDAVCPPGWMGNGGL